jgi:hypothetical protein
VYSHNILLIQRLNRWFSVSTEICRVTVYVAARIPENSHFRALKARLWKNCSY